MSTLPRVPTDLQGRPKEYLIELVRQLERELRRRPTRQTDGALYLAGDVPLHMVSPDGTVYRVTVANGGALATEVVTL